MPRKVFFLFAAFILSLGCPLGWILINIVFIRPVGVEITPFINSFIEKPELLNSLLYMAIGSAIIFSGTGFFIGMIYDKDIDKNKKLETLNLEITKEREDSEVRLQQMKKDMATLYVVGANIQKATLIKEVFYLLAEGVNKALNFDRVNVFILNPENNMLECRETRGNLDEDISRIKVPLSVEGGVIAKAVMENRTFHVEDVKSMPADYKVLPPYDQIKAIRSTSFVCVPIRELGRPIGLYAVDKKFQKKPIYQEDVDTLNVLADQIATAVTNLKLYEGMQTLHRELEKNFDTLIKKKVLYSTSIDELTKFSAELTNSAKGIETNASSLLDSIENINHSIINLSDFVKDIVKNVNSTSKAIEETSASMVEINSAVKNVEISAKESSMLGEEVKTFSEKGVHSVAKTIDGVQKIYEIMQSSVSVIDELEKKSYEIGEIVSVINEITDQVDLLALNAAIIAAQAGEHGKGFAVVAHEIKNLSSNTSSQTTAIKSLIETVQEVAKKSQESILQGFKMVESVLDVSKAAGEVLSGIASSSEKSLNMSKEIARATNEQVKGVTLVTQSVENIKEMMNRIIKATIDQTKILDETSFNSEKIRTHSQDVVNSTTVQVSNCNFIDSVIKNVDSMVDDIFSDAEGRKGESLKIVERIEGLTKKAKI